MHPQTREEYALARKERKTAPGYTGFNFDTSATVTLEEDLKRRDLTINAMAQTPQGFLIDPYRGEQDLKHKILRHVSDAFVEDPVRILRVARFAARFAHLDFTVAPETMDCMKKMVACGEVNALVPDRVWKELERALAEMSPAFFFKILAECGALPVLFQQLDVSSESLSALQRAAASKLDLDMRFAILCHTSTRDELKAFVSDTPCLTILRGLQNLLFSTKRYIRAQMN